MPKLTLLVCLHGDRSFLERLLRESTGCYDELLVIHDGTDFDQIETVTQAHGGRFFERPRAFSQEPHFPFAFGQARHDWILKLDSDEFPSNELRAWLIDFRSAPEPPRKYCDVPVHLAGVERPHTDYSTLA